MAFHNSYTIAPNLHGRIEKIDFAINNLAICCASELQLISVG